MINKRQQAAKTYKISSLDEKLIGKTFNNIKIIKYSHNIKYRRFYEVLCLRCNTQSCMRSDRFNLEQHKLNSCSNCRQDLVNEKSKANATNEAVYNILYGNYKTGAFARNIDFYLNICDFKKLISKKCFYCDLEPVVSKTSIRINKSDNEVRHHGIDRLDNNIGYHLENCVTCCKLCNMMKNNLTIDEFKLHIERIYHKSNK